MDTKLFINPETSMKIWRNLEIQNSINKALSHFRKNETHMDVASFLIDKQHKFSEELLRYIRGIDALIEQKTKRQGLYVWGIVPDLALVQVSDIKRESEGFFPPLTTRNVYTYQSLYEILFDCNTPKTAMFLLSEKCNLACKYCFEEHKDLKAMTASDVRKAVEMLFTDKKLKEYLDYEGNTPLVLEFMGGEPLLHTDLIKAACEHFYDCCAKYDNMDWLLAHQFNITSNGTLYFTDEAQDLLNAFPEITMSISLDGVKECHDLMRIYKDGKGSFDDTLKAVKEEMAKGRIRVPKMTFGKDTIKYIAENIKFMHSLGYPSVSISPALESEYTKEDGIAYYEELIKVADYLCENNVPEDFTDLFSMAISTVRPKGEPFCGGEYGMVTFAPDGNIYTCHRFRGDGNNRTDTRIGNLNEGFAIAGYEDNLDNIKEHGIFSKEWKKECEGCTFKGRCVGCPAIDFEKTGGFTDTVNTSGCFINLARYAAAVYYRAKRYGTTSQKYLEKEKERFLRFLPESEVNTLIELERMMTAE